MNEPILVGCDPEVFAVNIETNAPTSCIGKIGGTKEHPLQVNGGAVQEDGVTAEINIIPCRDSESFYNNISMVRNHIEGKLNKYNCKTHLAEELPFAEKELDHPLAQVFGCDPDYNVYKKIQNEPLDASMINPYRLAGGHIHCGIKDMVSTIQEYENFVVLMDLIVGFPTKVIMDKNMASIRHNYYGSFGNFRLKPYGIEYRTPSSLWLKNKATIQWVFDKVQFVANNFKKVQFTEDLKDVLYLHHRNCIRALQANTSIPSSPAQIRVIAERLEINMLKDILMPLKQLYTQ